MEWWSDGVLEELNCLKNGVMECWSIGVMGRMEWWKNGKELDLWVGFYQ